MYDIIIHTSNPRLKDSSLRDVFTKAAKPTLTSSVDTYLVTFYNPPRSSRYVPRRKDKFVDTGVVGKRLEIVETTYKSSYNEYTGELKMKKSVDRFDSGVYRD